MIVILSSRPLRDYFGLDLAAGQERRADLDVGAFADEQHLVERDGVADGGVETFHAQAIALALARYCLPPVRKTAYTSMVLLGDLS